MTHPAQDCEPAAAPHPPAVYLCQVADRLSCGACCGLYNVAGLSRQCLADLLGRRTAAFATVARRVDAIDDFARRCEGFTPRRRPFPGFHHCPFIGLIDGGRRVGCLLHPLAEGNAGIDWRGLSYYGGLACATYFCPTVRRLSADRLLLLREAFDHWYDYGLIVTERRLLAAVFDHLESQWKSLPAVGEASRRAAAAALLRSVAAIHRNWPYRRPDAPGPANYFFENGDYPRAAVSRPPGVPASRYEVIFRELESRFEAPAEQTAAEAVLDDLFAAAPAACDGD